MPQLFSPTVWFRWFGRNSYEIYLTHMFVIWPLVALFQRSGITIYGAPGLFIITTVLAGLLGWMVARFYSEPFNRWLRYKLVPRRAAGKEIAAGSSA